MVLIHLCHHRDSYLIVQCIAPRMLTLLHDSFRLNLETWGDFLQGCQNYAFDTHIYQAWVKKAKSCPAVICNG